MAAKAKKATGKKRGRPPKVKPEINKMWSVLLFGISAVLFALTYIEGQSLWSTARVYGLFGVFGQTAYLVAPAVLYIAVLVALEKPIKMKSVQMVITLLLVSALIQVFGIRTAPGETLGDVAQNLYSAGCNEIGGGVIALPLGWTLLKYFGIPAANVTLIILTIVFAMLLTGITPVDVFRFIGEKFSHVKEKADEYKTLRAELKEEEEEYEYDEEEEEELEETEPGIAPHAGAFRKAKARHKKEIDIALEEPSQNAAIDIDLGPDAAAFANELFVETVSADEIETNEEQDGQTALPLPKEKKSTYRKPSITLFDRAAKETNKVSGTELKRTGELLVETLASFGVQTKILNISKGPAVTRYELQPQAGVKISRITGLADDIALALATAGVRIEAPIPNKAAVGIEVPNKSGNAVNIRSILESTEFENSQSPLTLPLGKDIAGAVKVADLTKMPHILIAGATGSGKSVCINAIITSLLYKATPEEVKLILIDPKVVELSEYNGIPHLLMPVVTDPKVAAKALAQAVVEMEKRYIDFAENGVRDINSFNKLADDDTNEIERKPFIAIVIDELADLMMVASKDVEDYICRLAQKARAAGIHLVVATQRPSVDVITGLIKANIPSRIAFAVSSQVDSRTILDTGGAEKLLGMGDMLFLPVGASKPIRVQGAYVKDSEISNLITTIKKQNEADYDEEMIAEIDKRVLEDPKNKSTQETEDEQDPMLAKAIEVVVDAGQASTSLLQRKLKLGYARAARIMDEMEERQIIGPYEGSKPRQVNLTREQWIEMTMNQE